MSRSDKIAHIAAGLASLVCLIGVAVATQLPQ